MPGPPPVAGRPTFGRSRRAVRLMLPPDRSIYPGAMDQEPRHRLLRSTLTFWSQPRVDDPPDRVWWDWVIVVGGVVGVIVEMAVRSDVVWAPVAVVVTIGTLAVLPWRRTHAFPVFAGVLGLVLALNIVSAAMGVQFEGLYTMVVLLLLPYALFRWGSGGRRPSASG